MSFDPNQLRGTPKNKGSWAANGNGDPEATLGTSGAAVNRLTTSSSNKLFNALADAVSTGKLTDKFDYRVESASATSTDLMVTVNVPMSQLGLVMADKRDGTGDGKWTKRAIQTREKLTALLEANLSTTELDAFRSKPGSDDINIGFIGGPERP